MTRRSLALVGLVLLLGAPRASAQAPHNPADVAWRAGHLREAAQRYLGQAKGGEGGDTTWFNVGTAALAIGDTALAREGLGRAARSLDPAIRFRALYNLGLLELRLAATDTAQRGPAIESALQRYREALLLRPGDHAAKWNYEIALRLKPPAPQGGGAANQGGGGGGGEATPPSGGLSLAQAQQLLSSMADAERQTREEQLRRRRQAAEARGKKEW